jgi:hypothetical protein
LDQKQLQLVILHRAVQRHAGGARMTTLDDEFDAAMFDIYRRAKSEAKYNATIFLQMITTQRGRVVAKALINASKPSDGYTALFMRDRLDLTVEAMIIENSRWHELFTLEELSKARRRLADYRYEVKG